MGNNNQKIYGSKLEQKLEEYKKYKICLTYSKQCDSEIRNMHTYAKEFLSSQYFRYEQKLFEPYTKGIWQSYMDFVITCILLGYIEYSRTYQYFYVLETALNRMIYESNLEERQEKHIFKGLNINTIQQSLNYFKSQPTFIETNDEIVNELQNHIMILVLWHVINNEEKVLELQQKYLDEKPYARDDYLIELITHFEKVLDINIVVHIDEEKNSEDSQKLKLDYPSQTEQCKKRKNNGRVDLIIYEDKQKRFIVLVDRTQFSFQQSDKQIYPQESQFIIQQVDTQKKRQTFKIEQNQNKSTGEIRGRKESCWREPNPLQFYVHDFNQVQALFLIMNLKKFISYEDSIIKKDNIQIGELIESYVFDSFLQFSKLNPNINMQKRGFIILKDSINNNFSQEIMKLNEQDTLKNSGYVLSLPTNDDLIFEPEGNILNVQDECGYLHITFIQSNSPPVKSCLKFCIQCQRQNIFEYKLELCERCFNNYLKQFY